MPIASARCAQALMNPACRRWISPAVPPTVRRRLPPPVCPPPCLFIRHANGGHDPDEAMALSDFMQATQVLAWWLVNAAN